MQNDNIPVTDRRDLTKVLSNCKSDESSGPEAEESGAGHAGTRLCEGKSLAPGSILINRYELLKVLGEGGMGHVLQAHDRTTRKLCAVKVMHANLSGSATDLQRFEREASVSISLKHPNIVDVYDLGVTEDNKPFYVMEHIQGSSLADILYDWDRLNLSQFVNVFMQICDGISFAHDSGIVHRDIKPSNIMIQYSSGKQIVKIVDFGIARICKSTGQICPTTLKAILSEENLATSSLAQNDERLQRLTQPGEIFGSPLYMSPEQCRGDVADCRSEVFALGCMMFEALTGGAPLKGPSALQTLILRMRDHAPSINDVVPGLVFPPELEAIVARALEHEPLDRYASVSELCEAIRSFADTMSQVNADLSKTSAA